MKECSICRCDLIPKNSHNAEPVNDGRCCTKCNFEKVLPMRLQEIININKKEKGTK